MDIDKRVRELLKEFEKLPRFEDGRINYRKAHRAPVLMIFVRYNGKVLLLKRSQDVLHYKGKWNGVGGYIDENVPLRSKVLEELSEELDLTEKDIEGIYFAEEHEVHDFEVDGSWIIFPVLVELNGREMNGKNPEIKLDWEHTNFKWILPKDIFNYDIVYKLDKTLGRALNAKKESQ